MQEVRRSHCRTIPERRGEVQLGGVGNVISGHTSSPSIPQNLVDRPIIHTAPPPIFDADRDGTAKQHIEFLLLARLCTVMQPERVVRQRL